MGSKLWAWERETGRKDRHLPKEMLSSYLSSACILGRSPPLFELYEEQEEAVFYVYDVIDEWSLEIERWAWKNYLVEKSMRSYVKFVKKILIQLHSLW
jgi:hypothetical protein